jgi:hypothetical protein
MNIPQSQTQHPHAEREYLHTPTAAVLVPMAQATSLAIGVFAGIWLIGRVVFDAMDPHKFAVLFAVITWVGTLFYLFRHWLSLTTIQNVIMDFVDDGQLNDSVQPSAPSEARKVRIEVQKIDRGHFQSNTIDFPCDDEQLYTLAMGLTNNIPFTERAWTGAGKTFSTNEFREVKDVLKKHLLVEYVSDADPRQGMRLTAEGRALMEKIAAPSPAPSESLSDFPA